MALPELQLGFSLSLKTRPAVDLSEEDFFRLCQANSDLRFERTAEGDVIVMSPTGSETGRRNLDLLFHLKSWAEADGRGVAFDSSTGFTLPDGSVRSPDASWILRERYAALDAHARSRFAPICPDFVIELCSRTDPRKKVAAKMDAYLANGLRLGWMIDPDRRQVLVYRPGRPVEILDEVRLVSGDPELPGFRLELAEIWEPPL